MTAEQISALAAKGERPPDGLNATDWLLWYMLRDIYRDFKFGKLDAEKGAERKNEALAIWERENFNREQDKDAINRAVDLWNRVELAGSEYRQNRTIENADKLMEAIYHIPCG